MMEASTGKEIKVSRQSALLVVVLVLLLFHLPHLGSDVPQSLWSGSMGEFVDEGYKTLDARNRVTFGSAHWNAYDNYPGWTRGSPVTQSLYWLSFSWLGPELASARAATLVLFAIFLIGFVFGPASGQSTVLAVMGLLLLGIAHQLFVFSRSAHFEIAVIALAYSVLFVLSRMEKSRPKFQITMLAVAALVSTFGVKQSSLLYFGLVAAGLVLSLCQRAESRAAWSRARQIVAMLIVGLAALLVATRETWITRVELSPVAILRSLLESPLFQAAPLFVACGLVCATHLLISDREDALRSPYRAALITLVLGGPLVLAVFSYDPLRYYVPLLPAYLLITLEWLRRRAWSRPAGSAIDRVATPAWVLGSLMVAACIVHALNRFVIGPLSGLGSSPWVTGPIGLVAIAAAAPIVCALTWLLHVKRTTGQTLRVTVIALLIAAGCIDLFYDAHNLFWPSYRRQEIAADLEARLTPESSIAGDWAPLLTLGTRLKCLYMNEVFNRVERLDATQPDYVMIPKVSLGDGHLLGVPLPTGIEIGGSVYKFEFLGRSMGVYPVEYSHPADEVRP